MFRVSNAVVRRIRKPRQKICYEIGEVEEVRLVERFDFPPPQRQENMRFYHKEEKISDGPVVEVWKATDNRTDVIVAVKIVRQRGNEMERSYSIDSLSKCKNVVNYIESFRENKDFWVILEFMEGGDLRSICGTSKIWTESAMGCVCKQVLQALSFLHSAKQIHGDINPSNILFDFKGSVKISRIMFHFRNKHGKRQEKVFRAPEIFRDSKVDIWSLGITAMELSDGQPPLIEDKKSSQVVGSLHLDKRTDKFKHYVTASLMQDPARRPDAKTLLLHPFIRDSMSSEDFGEFARKLKYSILPECVPEVDQVGMDLFNELFNEASDDKEIIWSQY